MLASEYAQKMLEQVALHGDFPVAVTQDGYYADGVFADLYEPDAPMMLKEYTSSGYVDRGMHFVLGHSYQSY